MMYEYILLSNNAQIVLQSKPYICFLEVLLRLIVIFFFKCNKR